MEFLLILNMVHKIQFSTIVSNKRMNIIYVKEHKLIANRLKISKILKSLSVKCCTIHGGVINQ